MIGPGKYDELCTRVRMEALARGAALIIIGGEKGDGFSVQGPLAITVLLPELLRRMADQIEADLKGEGGVQ